MKNKKKDNQFLQAARAHFESLETKETEVEAWKDSEGDPVIVYSTPPTLAEKSNITKQGAGNDHALMVYMVIAKALDSQGNKMFTIADKHSLMNVADPVVVTWLANEIFGSYSVEEMKKK